MVDEKAATEAYNACLQRLGDAAFLKDTQAAKAAIQDYTSALGEAGYGKRDVRLMVDSVKASTQDPGVTNRGSSSVGHSKRGWGNFR